jgi:hypothetical protein
VNRLTKHISLVLISSSLVLHGCHSRTLDEEKKREDGKTPAGGTWGTGTGGHYIPTGPHFYHFGGSGSSRVGSSPGGGSAAGGSARGGFGGSAHGVSS